MMITTSEAIAGSHTWDVFEIFSDATGTIQFIELREMNNTPGETGVNGHNITSLIRTYLVPGPALTPPTSNKSLLFATPAYAALPGVPAPNYIFPSTSVPFFSTTNAETIAYTPWDTISFAAGALPTDGVHSLNRVGGTLVVGCATPKNYAGVTMTLNLACSMAGDVDGNGSVDGRDIAGFVRAKLGTPDGGDNAACAEYCTGTLNGDVTAFVNDLL
jgi:hypothetical protein